MNIKRIVPDSITCCNLLSGAVAVFFATRGQFPAAFLFIIVGAVFDFFDGMSARALGVSNAMGIEMDSLADDITFGLAPAIMLCCYLHPVIGYWSLIVLLMAAFSALRLAKFNLDTRQRSSFIGLATPPNAVFWGSLCCMPAAFVTNGWMPWVLVALSLVSCVLLVSEIPFFSLKFHNMTWKDNADKYIFLFGMLVLVVFCACKAVQTGQIICLVLAGAASVLWYVVLDLILLCIKR